jgi:hypothetical protein
VHRLRNTCCAALALVATSPVLGSAISSAADRAPRKAEAGAIKRVALAACRSGGRECEFRKARISTRNARFAWARVIGEGFSGALLKRPTARSRRFKVVGTQGGGISECSYWRARAPRGVLRDLRISGLLDAETFEVGNCGKRR